MYNDVSTKSSNDQGWGAHCEGERPSANSSPPSGFELGALSLSRNRLTTALTPFQCANNNTDYCIALMAARNLICCKSNTSGHGMTRASTHGIFIICKTVTHAQLYVASAMDGRVGWGGWRRWPNPVCNSGQPAVHAVKTLPVGRRCCLPRGGREIGPRRNKVNRRRNPRTFTAFAHSFLATLANYSNRQMKFTYLYIIINVLWTYSPAGTRTIKRIEA